MNWLVMNRGNLKGSSLGWLEGSRYVTSPDCKEALEALEGELMKEDLFTRNVRRSLCLSRVTEKDLVPILIFSEDKDILSIVVRVLVNVTMPVECLLPIQVASKIPTGQETLQHLNNTLLNTKRAFLDTRATETLVKYIKESLLADSKHSILKEERVNVNNCILLLRNILHVPDKVESPVSGNPEIESFVEWKNVQNKLIWNLFAQGLDIALILLMSNKNKLYWTIAIVQLIALLYKDQHVSKIQNLLTLMPDNDSDSSDDEVESDGSKCSGGNTSSSDSSKTGQSDSGCPQTSDCWSETHSPSTHKRRTSVPGSFNFGKENGSSSELSTSSSPTKDIIENWKEFNLNTTMKAEEKTNLTDKSTDTPNPKLVANRSANSFDDGSSGFCNSQLSDASSEEDVIITQVSANNNNQYSEWRGSNSNNKTNINNNNPHISLNSGKPSSHPKHRMANLKKQPSYSSNEDEEAQREDKKCRSHPPVGRKARSIGISKLLKCSTSICFDAALESATNAGKYLSKISVLEKRKGHRMVGVSMVHNPTEDDISNLLKDFTLNFLHNGFSDLVIDLKKLILVENPVILDKSHFLWLLTYFLRLSATLSLSFHHVRYILSADIISYLTFEGVMMCEELDLFSRMRQPHPKALLRRMHLLVTAFREVITTMDSYSRKPIVKREKAVFEKLRCQISEMSDVRQVFLLLIRNYSPSMHSKQYLVDIITTNHLLLMQLEKVMDLPSLVSHLKQFADVRVMEQYGKVLEDFRTNSEFVNDCIFTMMHHVAGDLKVPQALFQPIILKMFCKIMEDESERTEILPFWEDLMSYILNKFMRAAERCPQACVRKLFGLMTVSSDSGKATSTHTLNDCESLACSSSSGSSSSSSSHFKVTDREDSLYWWYLQFEHNDDPIGKMVEHAAENEKQYSREQVIQELLTQGVITQTEYEKFKAAENKIKESNVLVKIEVESPGMDTEEKLDKESVGHLVAELKQAGMTQHLVWLQRVLVEACYVKIGLRKTEECPVEDPIPYHSMVMNRSTPLVPYSDSQELALHNDSFIQLLHKLGFHLSVDVGKIYPRIPCFWKADVLYSVAAKLGDIDKGKLKFNSESLTNSLQEMKIRHNSENVNNEDEIEFSKPSSSAVPFPSLKIPAMAHSWLSMVQQSKMLTSCKMEYPKGSAPSSRRCSAS